MTVISRPEDRVVHKVQLRVVLLAKAVLHEEEEYQRQDHDQGAQEQRQKGANYARDVENRRLLFHLHRRVLPKI